MRKTCSFVVALLLALLRPAPSMAGDPSATCEAGKLGVTAKYAQCRWKADAKAVGTGGAADYSKCSVDKFADAESKAGPGVCPTEGDQATVKNYLDDCTARASLWLAGGGGLPDTTAADLAACRSATCGNAAAEYGEACDGSDLRGKTCATEAPATPWGALACSGTCDAFDPSGCLGRFTSNADGTITDNQTKLIWEKKSDDGSVHDRDNHYTWGATSPPYAPTGTVFTGFLATLNGASNGTCFAGHCDWRLPTQDELEGLIDPSAGLANGNVYDPYGDPYIAPVFKASCYGGCSVTDCSCANSDIYWTSTTDSGNPATAWTTQFYYPGYSGANFKNTTTLYARAVRGGS